MERVEVFGLGQCSVDRLGFVKAYPAPDEKTEFHGLTTQCGGPVATALVALSRWGRRCAMGGIVGDDAPGIRIRADLVQEGVDATRLLTRTDSLSQYAFIAVEEDSGRRMIFWQRPTGRPPEPIELDPPPCDVFMSDGIYVETDLACAHAADRVVVDAGTMRDGTRALLDVADVFVSSESFARAFTGDDDPAGACRKMREHGVKVAGVTLGARGYVALYGDEPVERPAYPVAAVDTTGCGDAFHAGLVEGMLSGWDWLRSFDFAAWVASRCATALGGRAGLPEAQEYVPEGYP
ncbi:MAG: carbohydrate kinase family protein [Planctomycetota bacterium]